MGRPKLEKVSQREYSRRLGISNEAVRKAVAAGKISKGWDNKEKKIIVEKANEEWGNEILAKGKKETVDFEKAQTDAIKRIQEFAPQVKRKQTFETDEDDDDLENNEFYKMSDDDFVSVKITDTTPLPVSNTIVRAAEAKLKQIDVRERIGQLVDKEKVYKQLFEFGQSVRQAVLAVPDRHIDSIISTKSRGEAHIKLTNALHEALAKLADADKMTFQQQENEK